MTKSWVLNNLNLQSIQQEMKQKQILKHDIQNEAGQATKADPIDKEHTGNKKYSIHTYCKGKTTERDGTEKGNIHSLSALEAHPHICILPLHCLTPTSSRSCTSSY